MKRIQEKVKDLVEVRVYRSLQDFTGDPAQTLAAYHFTDATSEMMTKWLDGLAGVHSQNGAAKALAGYRGVGKSHFFATFAAVVSHPDLRSKITDSYVAAGAQQLKRRHYPVAFVRRGTHETLLEEIKEAIGRVFQTSPASLGNDLNQLVNFCAQKAGDLPFVLMVDTAFDRAARVSRDDGVLLGELAEITKNLNFFIAVALDDDIASADGVNAAIARNYTIDYLDQEHLYRVVETHIFPKLPPAQLVLRDIHENFREVLPAFRWSLQRFASLYPVHPVILEIAQFIRLYAPDFAFLGFVSEAGAKVMGRPANSLVGLDEVFDRVENSLRKAEDLREAFAAFDRLNAEVVSQVPVMQRLQAKLVLKALLLLSLNDDGTTATDIASAMLIYDENDSQRSQKSIEELLETFVSAFPEQVRRKTAEGRQTFYSFKVSGKDNLNDVLAEAAAAISADVFENTLRRFARERFSDWSLEIEDETPGAGGAVDCQISWRGGCRRGRVVWDLPLSFGGNGQSPAPNAEFIDWEVIVGGDAAAAPEHSPGNAAVAASSPVSSVRWRPAPLRADEEETLRRYYVLLTDKDLHRVFGEQVRAAGHTFQQTVAKIWERIFLEEGKFLIDGVEHSFPESARNAAGLSDLLSEMMAPLFEKRYPQHPVFDRNLGLNEVSVLVSEHFSGAKPTLPEAQELAKSFALPLGLVALHGNYYILNSDEKRVSQPFVREVMSLVGESAGETVTLKNIYRQLKQEPFGLVHEAVHLVLSALVAQRHVEFVTSKGDRINRRSLDLRIIWDDIVGVAAPSTVLYGSAKLTGWARTLTAADSFRTIDDPADREKIKQALDVWLSDWRASKVLERFEELPAEILTTKIWRVSTHVQKTFGSVAATVESVLNETISLEEGLQRVADAFSDSEEEFFRSTKDLMRLEDFIKGARLREKVWKYLAVCEATGDEKIEGLRAKILDIVGEMQINPNESLNQQLAGLWQEFQSKFSEHFSIKHYTIMKSHGLQEKYDEILQSDEWWEFENLSALPIFQKTFWKEAQKISRRFRELNCGFDTTELLKTYPFCACSFRLSQIGEWENLPQVMAQVVSQGRKRYRKTLSLLGETLAPLFEHFRQTEGDAGLVEAAARLADNIVVAEHLPLFKNEDLVVLRKAIQTMPSSPLLQISAPSERGLLSREELRLQVDEWLDELPSEPVLLKI